MGGKSVTYSSTRGAQKNLTFREAVMTGLAHDRGLFVPDSLPHVTAEELDAWKSLIFKDLAVEVIRKFVKDDQVPLSKLKDIVGRSCDAFRSDEVTPVIAVGGHSILVRTVLESILVVPDSPFVHRAHRSISHSGALPRTYFCVQGCRTANAWELL